MLMSCSICFDSASNGGQAGSRRGWHALWVKRWKMMEMD